MRALCLVAIVASCVPSAIVKTAGDRLGTHGRHLHLVDHDDRTYTFCRDEHRSLFYGRSYDGACVTLICDADGTGCR